MHCREPVFCYFSLGINFAFSRQLNYWLDHIEHLVPWFYTVLGWAGFALVQGFLILGHSFYSEGMPYKA